jgi:hypothetical protein
VSSTRAFTVAVAEADGNRTRLARIPGHTGFEDREEHQPLNASDTNPVGSARSVNSSTAGKIIGPSPAKITDNFVPVQEWTNGKAFDRSLAVPVRSRVECAVARQLKRSKES